VKSETSLSTPKDRNVHVGLGELLLNGGVQPYQEIERSCMLALCAATLDAGELFMSITSEVDIRSAAEGASLPSRRQTERHEDRRELKL
jgi:hypothetical protein